MVSKEKQGNWFGRHKIFTVILVIAVVGGIAAAASGGGDAKVVDTKSDDSSQSTGDKVSEKTQFKVNEVISFDSKEVTVTEVARNWSTNNQFVVPDSGKEFVKVQVTIKNNSKSDILYNSFDWKVKDSQNVLYDIASATFMIDGSLGSDTLAAGDTVSGFLAFEVPEGDTGLKLQYSPSFWSGKKLEINI